VRARHRSVRHPGYQKIYIFGVVTFRITKLRAMLLANVDEKGEKIKDYVVAADCGIIGSYLCEYASGKKAFRPDHLEKLCWYFQCDTNDLAGSLEFTVPD
jgi:hypothetical protein